MSAMNASSTRCPRCGANGSGKFCSDCGAPRTVGGSVVQPTRPARQKPNAAAGVAALALVGLVVVIAVQLGSRPAPSGTRALGPTPQGTVVPAPDISSMSPRERAARLYDRIMRLHEQRKADSIAFFAPMALASYAAIPDIDLDARYDMARIAMVAGALPLARAQGDTILRRDSTHLLGLLLAADLARSTNNEAAAARAERTFVAAAPRERKRNLPEYSAHASEIDAVLRRLTSTKP